MIFLGDTALPSEINFNIDNLPEAFKSNCVVANLEGAISSVEQANLAEHKLFSNDCVLDFLEELNVKAVTLANNHITDVPEALDRTLSLLDEKNFQYCGAGRNIEEARKPAIVEENNKKYVLLAFGWDTVSCKYATEKTAGVNPLEYDNIIGCIKHAKENYPDCGIITLMHWDYELEKYPMPAHRKLAKELIDLGVEAVIGHHPHCVQGIEIYKGKPVVYSLGNWFLPQGIYMGGKLNFPDYASEEMAVEIKDGFVTTHWFKYDKTGQKLMFVKSEDFSESERIAELTPFKDMSNEEYAAWFSKHRIKKKLLPIYFNPKSCLDDTIKDSWVKLRQHAINFLFATLRKRNNKS